MQHSAHNASGRREDRVPLAAVVSVRDPMKGDTLLGHAPAAQLEADGLNVSIGGIAMRARFVPEPGAMLECSFTCPPTGEVVSAHGEVVWSEPHGLGHGQFGLRFVELDTKSATALRKLVHKDQHEAPKVAQKRSAQLRIDGLDASVDTELKLIDESRAVIEQPLTFLQLGRAVEVVVPGRGQERGRIASVELRTGHTPTLVFGILLDDAPGKSVAPVVGTQAAWFTGELEDPFPGLHAVKKSAARERPSEAPPERISEIAVDRTSEISLDRASERSLDRASARFRDPAKTRAELAREALANMSPTTTLPGLGARLSDMPSEVKDEELRSMVHAEPEEEERVITLAVRRTREPVILPEELKLEEEGASSESPPEEEPEAEASTQDSVSAPLKLRNLPAHVRSLFQKPAAQFAELRQKLEPALREQAESLDLPEAKTRMIERFARLRLFFAALFARFKRQKTTSDDVEPAEPRKRAPRLRMQRTTLMGIGGESDPEVVSSPRTRVAAVAVAVIGVGLGAYALAPRAPTDRIELPARIAAAQNVPEPVISDDAVALDIEPPPAAPAKAEGKKKKKDVAPVEAAKPDVVAPAPFGEVDVPNGRMFTLRMNGPITSLEGQAFENGFTVKIPGRNPIDPARPIASSHRAVKRALFMNQGKYAELTIEFLPGFNPRYQVRAKGDSLEITLERL